MDLRVRKTYSALVEAFADLLERYRYEQISVAMLCEHAKIRRTTFYKHFADKNEFFRFFMGRISSQLGHPDERVRALVCRGNAGVPAAELTTRESRELIRAVMDFMVEREPLVSNVFESSMAGAMMEVIAERAAERLRIQHGYTLRAGGTVDKVSADVAVQFAAGGIVRLVDVWWTQGHREEERAFVITAGSALATHALTCL